METIFDTQMYLTRVHTTQHTKPKYKVKMNKMKVTIQMTEIKTNI